MLTIWAILSVILVTSTVPSIVNGQALDAGRLSIVSIDPVPKFWPVIMAANYDNSGDGIDIDRIIFTWNFILMEDQTCTFQGRPNAYPCRGQVMEKGWFSAGTWFVYLTASLQGQPSVTIAKNITVTEDWTGPTATRQEVLSLPRNTWNSYVQALWQMKSLGIYDHFVFLHQIAGTQGVRVGSNRNAAHRGPAFLPWHRVFLRNFERTVQVLSGIPTLGIPYWNWTADMHLPNGPQSSVMWTDDWLGPDGDSTSIVRSGPFCSQASSTCNGRWPLLGQLDGPSLRRELGRFTSTIPTDGQIQTIMGIRQYDGTRYDDLSTGATSFRSSLEGWVGGPYGGGHNTVHMFVGGSMGPLTSPNDPVFYLHHSNADRIWYEWQQLRGCYSDCYQPKTGDGTVTINTPASMSMGDGVYSLPGHEWESRLYPWYIHPSDVADRSNSVKGYVYQ